MSISGKFDIYNSLFNFNTTSISIRNPQTEYLFRGIVAVKYTNSINKDLSEEINTFMNAFKNQLSEVESTMDSLFSYEESSDEYEVEEDLYSFVDTFNNLKGLLNDNTENPEVNLVNKQLDNLTDEFDDDLNSIGITKDSNGLLEIEEDKLSEISEENPEHVEEIFNKKNSFGNKLKSRIKTVEELPESVFFQDKIVENSELTNNNFYNYFSDAQKFSLSLDQSQGTLIDMFF